MFLSKATRFFLDAQKPLFFFFESTLARKTNDNCPTRASFFYASKISSLSLSLSLRASAGYKYIVKTSALCLNALAFSLLLPFFPKNRNHRRDDVCPRERERERERRRERERKSAHKNFKNIATLGRQKGASCPLVLCFLRRCWDGCSLLRVKRALFFPTTRARETTHTQHTHNTYTHTHTHTRART